MKSYKTAADDNHRTSNALKMGNDDELVLLFGLSGFPLSCLQYPSNE